MRPARTAILALALAAVALGCGADPGAAPASPEAAARAPRPRNAAALAEQVAGGQVSPLVYWERAKSHPSAPEVLALEPIRAFLDGTGLDPQKDVRRFFVTAPSLEGGHGTVAVADHLVDAPRLRRAMDTLVAKNPGSAWLEGTEVPMARITHQGHVRVVALVGPDEPDPSEDEPAFVVILPEDKASAAAAFGASGGFPEPGDDELAIVNARDPHLTLRAPRAPIVPPTVTSVRGVLRPAADGGLDLAITAPSAGPEQAAEDAAVLTRGINDATSIRIAFIKVRFFQAVHLRAEGEIVRGDVHLAPSDLSRLLGFARAAMPGG